MDSLFCHLSSSTLHRLPSNRRLQLHDQAPPAPIIGYRCPARSANTTCQRSCSSRVGHRSPNYCRRPCATRRFPTYHGSKAFQSASIIPVLQSQAQSCHGRIQIGKFHEACANRGLISGLHLTPAPRIQYALPHPLAFACVLSRIIESDLPLDAFSERYYCTPTTHSPSLGLWTMC